MKNMKYCPKCGALGYPFENKCMLCGTSLFETNPKWEITEEKYDNFMTAKTYGEKTRSECLKDIYDFWTPFFDEVVKKRPEFDPELFRTRIKRDEEYWDMHEKRAAEYEEYYKKYLEPIKVKTNPHGVKCPTCHSTNTQKISGVERATSVGLFGLFSKKIGKTWKCNSCGYTW